MYINRGSEWRRWELHLHTPFTKREDQYEGRDADEKWDNFYQTIKNYIGDATDPLKDIAAIAITDYLSIANYLKVRDDKRLPESVKLILPNVELRMQPIAQDSPINIHCIFSPGIVNQIEDRFFSKLEFEFNGNKYSASKSQLISLGRAFALDNSLPEEEAECLGRSQYVLEYDVLLKIFRNDQELRKNTIIAVSNKTNDGVSGTRTHSQYFERNISQLEATRRSIYQFTDMVFSATQSDISYFLGERADSENIVKAKCGSLMPCVHGSDAHTNEKVFEPDDMRYCWIKSDTTFEGLKQILFEPKDRVRISSSYPESKQSYHVIDRVEIDGNANFSPEPIYFNENLTCVIGGKSTGKSLLLHNIALAIDKEQVKDKEETVVTNVKAISGFKVYWRDGICSDGINKLRKIVYIPQTYLNRLSDEKEETTEIDNIVQGVVLQDRELKKLHENMVDGILRHKRLIAQTIVDFMQTVKKRDELFDNKMEIGDKEGINQVINKLSKELELLSIDCDIKDGEVQTYQNAIEEVNHIQLRLQNIGIEKNQIKALETVLQKIDLNYNSISEFEEEFDDAIKRIQDEADNQWLVEKSGLVEKMEIKIAELKQDLKNFTIKIENLRPKMEANERLSKISDSIVIEKEKMNKILKLDNELEKINKLFESQLNLLINSFETYKGYYKSYIDGANRSFVSPTEDLEFRASCVFRAEQFSEKILEILDNRSIARFKSINFHKISEADFMMHEKVKSFIESLIANSSETLKLKNNNTLESAFKDIFSNWYNVDYIVKMDNDSIEEMSPGKKALVLLRLLISLAESKCPILIDQPEDDLDNRSIFDELICFIKAKKIDRQIIMATHNANIVLGGDAELVIVANQRGSKSSNNMYRFEYRGGSIEDNLPVKDDNGNIKGGILNQKGIQTHICEILEGGKQAFDLRKSKYRFDNFE
ncbi:hypothetical protein J0B03_09745 [Alkalibacter rhizosphaerae]|uniref:DNA repair protein n=1 Tax=Alkalibacter rhizosphaerae TaxID=2815577 RepID=A0A974XDX7_9FIRM|nr:hypothetical protein [Alkalibacter rhizosphaerae]QSX08072.1 hypothetical protein J0B03_09745 [Alkalibacter rhizosphaerae]